MTRRLLATCALSLTLLGCPGGETQETPAASSPAPAPSTPATSSPSPASESTPMTTPQDTPASTPSPDRLIGPGGAGEGPLSRDFPEVEVKVTASFAHDRGMMSTVESVAVGGEPCQQHEALAKLIALRGGWSASGDSSEAAVLETFKAYQDAWGAALPESGRMTSAEAPDSWPAHFPTYHPPRVAIYTNAAGEKVVAETFFRTWDGGNHGRQYAFEVEAYRISDGAWHEFPRRDSGPGSAPPAPAPSGSDQLPVPRHLGNL